MNQIKIFENAQFGQIRTVMSESNEPMFCLSDVCNVIGIKNSRDAKNRLDKEDVGQIDTLTAGGTQNLTYVTESGLYDVIIRSDSPKAKPFRKWVTFEVLPSIRKHGAYMTAQTIEQVIQKPENLIKLLTALKDEQEQNEALRIQREYDKKVIKELAPRAEYCDNVLKSDSLISTNVIAADLGITARKLNQLLKEWKVQYRQGKTWVLYSHLRGKNFADYKTYSYIDSRTETLKTVEHMYWTEFGRAFIIELYSKSMSV